MAMALRYFSICDFVCDLDGYGCAEH
jgi:hypothetical protein